MSMSRTASSIKNSKMSIVAQICSILLNFIGRTFFIRLLNIEYLGVNGLFSNILGLLSLAELGVGTAITYMMYKPIAENDIKKVAAYNNLFRKVYTTVGLIILGVGLVISPFINFFIREQPDISENLFIIYVLFFNEWFLRDTSKKIRNGKKTRAKEGKVMTTYPTYRI